MRSAPLALATVVLSCCLATPPTSESAASPTTEASAPTASTFEVQLQGFTDNVEVENIGYVRMVIEVDGSTAWNLAGEGIGGACSGWRESTGSGSINGPSVFMSAHDETAFAGRVRVGYPLEDGLLFWLDCSATVTGLSQITFWKAPDIGNFEANEYPGQVRLVAFSSSRAVFSTRSVPAEAVSWTRVKRLYR